MVVFENGHFQKNSYRKFNIVCSNNNTNDDYYMMNQVIRRRFNISSKWKSNIPKLIVIDGGKGQLNIVEKAINEKGLKILT